jgi:hypothetical protein
MAFKLIKPRDSFGIQPGYEEAIYYDIRKAFIRLSTVDGNNYFFRHGKYPEKAWIEWENWKAQAITQIMSFNPLVDIPEVDETFYIPPKTMYTLSNNDGQNYYYYDNDNEEWKLVTDDSDESQWNTAIDIDKNIETFPFIYDSDTATIQLKPKILMFSGGKKYKNGTHDRSMTPTIHHLAFIVRYDYDTFIDLSNSVQKYIKENLKSRFYGFYKMESDSDSFDVNTEFNLIEGIRAYNLTKDPNKENDIFQSLSNNKITLTETSDTDDIIEFVFNGGCPVVVQEDPELVKAKIPFIVIRGVDKESEKSMGSFEGNYYLNKISSNFSYVGKEPRWSTSLMRIVCQGNDAGTSMQLAGAVASLFEHNRVVRSLATGDYFYIMYVKPYEDNSNIEEGSNKKLLFMNLLYQDWARDGNCENIEEIKNIEEIVLNMEVLGHNQTNDGTAVEEDVKNYG